MKIEINAPLAQVAGLLCAGFEGGCGYWARIEDYRAPPGGCTKLGGSWEDGAEFPHIHYPLSEGGAVILRDTTTGETHALDLDAVRRGLEVMAREAPRHFGDWLAENDDATTGDVFIQCCLFGEVLYG